MRERLPFAVVGSNITITDQDTGLRYRGREYPWGCVNIEDKVSKYLLLVLFDDKNDLLSQSQLSIHNDMDDDSFNFEYEEYVQDNLMKYRHRILLAAP